MEATILSFVSANQGRSPNLGHGCCSLLPHLSNGGRSSPPCLSLEGHYVHRKCPSSRVAIVCPPVSSATPWFSTLLVALWWHLCQPHHGFTFGWFSQGSSLCQHPQCLLLHLGGPQLHLSSVFPTPPVTPCPPHLTHPFQFWQSLLMS